MKYVFICALALLITGALAGGAARYRRSHVPITQDTSVTDKQLPIIISAIKSLEIVHAFVDTHGQLNVVLRNKSEKGIQAFTVSAGTYSETLDEGLVMDHPKVIIEPKAEYTIDIPIANLKTTIPVVISAVIYADDTEEGNANIVNRIRKARQKERAKRVSKAAESKGNQ